LQRRVCPLCLLPKQIVRSHLTPQALYRDMRVKDGGVPDPVVVSDGTRAHQTSLQITRDLLCSDCEGVLSRDGENYVLRECQREDSFPLQERLRQAPRVVSGNTAFFPAREIPGIDVDALTHFAVGVVWKAAVCTWQLGQSKPIRVDLPPNLLHRARYYLRAGAPLPAEMLVSLSVPGETDAPAFFTPPKTYALRPFQRIAFYVPGLEFQITIGRREELAQLRESSLSGSQEGWVRVASAWELPSVRGMLQLTADVEPSAALGRWLEVATPPN